MDTISKSVYWIWYDYWNYHEVHFATNYHDALISIVILNSSFQNPHFKIHKVPEGAETIVGADGLAMSEEDKNNQAALVDYRSLKRSLRKTAIINPKDYREKIESGTEEVKKWRTVRGVS